MSSALSSPYPSPAIPLPLFHNNQMLTTNNRIARLSEKHGAKAHFIQIDVDDLPDVAQELSIRAMPTFKVFKDGEPFDSLIGAHPGKLNDLVEKAVATVA